MKHDKMFLITTKMCNFDYRKSSGSKSAGALNHLYCHSLFIRLYSHEYDCISEQSWRISLSAQRPAELRHSRHK